MRWLRACQRIFFEGDYGETGLTSSKITQEESPRLGYNTFTAVGGEGLWGVNGRSTHARPPRARYPDHRAGALTWQEGAVLSMLMILPEALDLATQLTILHETMVLIEAALSACQSRRDVLPVVLETPSAEEVRRVRVRTRIRASAGPYHSYPRRLGRERFGRAKLERILGGGARVSRRVSAQLGCQARPGSSPAAARQLHSLTCGPNVCVRGHTHLCRSPHRRPGSCPSHRCPRLRTSSNGGGRR